MEKHHQFNLLFLVFALFGIFLLQDVLQGLNRIEEIPYSRFVELTEDGQVTDLVIGSEKILSLIHI